MLSADVVAAGTETTADRVTVTASRIEQSVTDVPANVSIIDRDDIKRSAAQTVDDLLRRLPGFSLFRRQSSLVAHPTTQGVSLRGIGPSGVSRTLVLLDGIPLNDPFGGWIYWSKIPTELIERIEVVRGGGSSVWGNAAMGGVINIITTVPDEEVVRLRAAGGNRGTADVQSVMGRGDDDGGFLVDGAYFNTAGYYQLDDADRGSIDQRADSHHGTGGLHLRRRIGPDAEARGMVRYFREKRDNGTELTGNDTKSFFARAGLEHTAPSGAIMSFDAFGQSQTFESTFSAQAVDRNSEIPALDQFDVPSSSLGTVAKWSQRFSDTHLITAGADYLWVDGKTNEDYRNLGAGFTRRRLAGGRQHLAGVYLQDLYAASPRLDIAVALRLDYWRAYDGRRKERELTDSSLLVDDEFSDRDEWLVSPRVGAVYEATEILSLRASAYRGFRAPTINELHRPFRVRNDITEANASLDPERLWGAEGGLDFDHRRGRTGLTGYWNRIDDPIANVTIAPGPGTIAPCGFVPANGVCRRRSNLGNTRILGAEADTQWMLAESVTAGASYLYSDSEIRSAPADPTLEGNRVVQVPRHQATTWLTWEGPADITTTLELRYVGDQYDDDLNERKLGDYTTVNVSILKSFARGWQLFAGLENAFDEHFATGKTADGLVTRGAPLLAHAGIRFELPTD
jgi:outer membrane receptor protein involved in Fe transport